jgi:hypothetical protein
MPVKVGTKTGEPGELLGGLARIAVASGTL